IFVVAAGNDYNFGTIGTPGVAAQAITVGATDPYDGTADFSSKGPTPDDYRIKPDVAAPGIDIYSDYLNNSYKSLSGTSMASPHVAGAAALLLEKHPDWTPEVVKSVLMESAKSSTENLFRQGAGRIDILKAIKQEYVVTPGSISLGLSDNSSNTKTYSILVQIRNLCNTPKTITVLPDNFPAAISVTLNENTFSLPANATKSITLSINVNAPSLPFLNYPDAYFGSLVTNDGSTSISVPVVLLNPAITRLTFTGELPQSIFQVGLDGAYFNHQYPTSPEVKLLLPPGNFDLISIYGNRIVVNENIDGQQGSTIVVDKAQAKNVVAFKPKDEKGNTLNYDPSTVGSVTFTSRARNFICFFPYVEDTVYISDQSAYYVNMRLRDKIPSKGNAFYDINITTPEGINASKVYSNNPGDFAKIDVLNPSLAKGSTQDLFYHSQGQVFGLINSYPVSVSNPVEIFYSKRDRSFPNFSFMQLNPQDGQSGYSWEAGGFTICNNDSIYFFDSQRQQLASSTLSDNHFEYNLGNSLLRLNARTYNREDKIVMHDFPSQGSFNNFFGERTKGTVYYKLRQDNITVKSGSFINRTSDEYVDGFNIELDGASDQYSISLRYEDNFVEGKLATAIAELKFDMSSLDKNPPALQYLSLEADDIVANHLETGQQGKIVFGISDVCLSYYGMECSDENAGLKSLELNIKGEGENEWTNLALLEISEQWRDFKDYESYLPNSLANGYYDVKIKAVDQHNNSFEYQLNP
ncbi:MAG TPA: S8 family serine peptidase, partial [Cyclobacteriaceae bacterium]|nr:S8 family serine peptidase [Cyclobacteriaceae bacterium]